MVAATAPSSVPPAAWLEHAGAIIVPRRASRLDHARLALAVLVTASALLFGIVGALNPAWVGFADLPGVFYLTAPALVLAALIHLLLIYTGIRRPIAAFSPAGVRFQGYSLRRDQITKVFINRTPYGAGNHPTLMLATTREDWPQVPVLPPGYLPDEDLNALYLRLKTMLSS